MSAVDLLAVCPLQDFFQSNHSHMVLCWDFRESAVSFPTVGTLSRLK